MQYTEAFNAFAGHLINHLIDANHTGNLIVSPLSISTCLGMILLGCRNNSSDQLMNILKFPSSASLDTSKEDSIYRTYLSILKSSQSGDDGADELLLLNKALVRSNTVLPSYLESLGKYFLSSIDPLDDTAMVKANEWISKVTNGKIKSIIQSPPDALDRVILLNAIYFKGKWKYMFPHNYTHDAQFMVNGDTSNKKPVKMMALNKKKLNFAEFVFESSVNDAAKIGVQAVELPYMGNRSMVIFLPVEGQNVNSLLASSESLSSLMDSFDSNKKRREVNVNIPKFTFDMDTDLTGALEKLGAGDITKEGVADLSGVDGTKNLYVSKVTHKAVIDVSEEGTIAAAATSAVMTMRSFTFVTELYADHPFIFVIRDSTSKLISFVGKFSEP